MSINNTHYGYKKISEYMENAKKVFFIGAGGSNMASLALYTVKKGYKVAGVDRASSQRTDALIKAGVEVSFDENEVTCSDANLVVYTVAISEDNANYVYAKEHGINCVSRADYLGYIMMDYYMRIGVSGTHGKSSTTGMLANIFIAADTDPTVFCGAELSSLDGNSYRCGDDKTYIITESCEYKDSFLDFNPNLALILNIELDHVDYFESLDQIKNSFISFAKKCGDSGTVIVNADDKNCMDVLASLPSSISSVTFGFGEKASFRACNVKYENGFPNFDIFYENQPVSSVKLSVCGEHNILNATAAFAVAYICGTDTFIIEKALYDFKGVHRRCEYKGKFLGADVFDDYAHHPTEVQATIRALKTRGYERVICVFQPHTFSRTKALLSSLAESLKEADKVILTDIYPARETDNLGISSASVAKRIGEKAECCGPVSNIKSALEEALKPKDAVVIMGAGDINESFTDMGFEI